MRVLLVSKHFPSSVEPFGSLYNRNQYGELGKLCAVEVLATIPWLPGGKLWGRWSAAGNLVAVPKSERIADLQVHHPRFPYVPGLPAFGPTLYAAALAPHVWARRGEIDVIVGSCVYPDGVACLALGKLLGIPTVLQALGTDLNLMPTLAGPRQILKLALPHADRVVAVSRALAERAIELGAPAARTLTIANGVPTDVFKPRDREASREALGLETGGRLILFVGNLLEAKGVRDLLAAFELIADELPDVRLAVVGEGPERGRCEELAARLPGRLVVAGGRPQGEVATFMGAADVFTLPSWREGTPNVVLEALASGRRVVATEVGGIPQLVDAPARGELVPPHDPPALAAALRRGLATPADPQATRHGLISWAESARLLHDVLRGVVEEHRRGRAPGSAPTGARSG